MREIKFRSFDKEHKKMTFPDIFGNQMPSNWKSFYDLMQFTGLTDKNGVDIYEGDVLSNGTGRTGKVLWLKFAAMWDCEPVCCLGNPEGFQSNLWSQCVEVIGNIHENPELLKGE